MADPQLSQQVYRDQKDAPLRKLSVDLIKTYKHINEVFLILNNFNFLKFFNSKSIYLRFIMQKKSVELIQ
jgi:hypothetical protein